MLCDKDFSQPFYVVFEIVLNRENNIKFIPVHGINSEGEGIYDIFINCIWVVTRWQ